MGAPASLLQPVILCHWLAPWDSLMREARCMQNSEKNNTFKNYSYFHKENRSWGAGHIHHPCVPAAPGLSRDAGGTLPGASLRPWGGAEPAGRCRRRCCPRPRSCRSPWCTGRCASATSARPWAPGAGGFLSTEMPPLAGTPAAPLQLDRSEDRAV